PAAGGVWREASAPCWRAASATVLCVVVQFIGLANGHKAVAGSLPFEGKSCGVHLSQQVGIIEPSISEQPDFSGLGIGNLGIGEEKFLSVSPHRTVTGNDHWPYGGAADNSIDFCTRRYRRPSFDLNIDRLNRRGQFSEILKGVSESPVFCGGWDAGRSVDRFCKSSRQDEQNRPNARSGDFCRFFGSLRALLSRSDRSLHVGGLAFGWL